MLQSLARSYWSSLKDLAVQQIQQAALADPHTAIVNAMTVRDVKSEIHTLGG